jgi:PAS domain S-box-containing protein
MPERDSYPEITLLKNQILDLGLIIGSALGTVIYLLSLLKFQETGFQISFITDLIATLAVISITIYRKKISLTVKSYIILAGLFIIFTVDLLLYGLLSANKVVLVLIPFFALIVFQYSRVMIIYSVGIVIFLIVALLVVTHRNPLLLDGTKNLDKFIAWVINLGLLIIVTSVISIAFYKFNQTYRYLLEDLKSRNITIAENEQSYREIFNATGDAIFIHDLRGKIIEVNNAMLKTYGYEKEDIPSLTFKNFSSGLGKYTGKNAYKLVQSAMRSEKTVFDWQAKTKTGELFWVEVTLKKTFILGKERIVAVITNIDEKKKNAIELEKYRNHLENLVEERTKELEATNLELKTTNEELFNQREDLQRTLKKLKDTQDKLIHSEKMASLGVLSAGVAHEINNPLNFIQGGLTGLEYYFEENNITDNEDINQLLKAIEEGINRASAIVTSLHHFSRQGDSKQEECNIHGIINNCLVILQNQTKNKIEITKSYTPEDPKVVGNDGKLHRAILNVITNAIQAVPEKGHINIQTKVIVNKLYILIRDDGTGIKAEQLPRITEPFFTTKEPGKGTGLGLSITYTILQEHGGKLAFESEPGKGTVATIILPLMNES